MYWRHVFNEKGTVSQHALVAGQTRAPQIGLVCRWPREARIEYAPEYLIQKLFILLLMQKLSRPERKNRFVFIACQLAS